MARGLVAGASLLLTSAAPQAASNTSLCKPSESTLFACPIAKGLLSACRHKGVATYRFGRPGRIELEIRGGRFAQRGYSGGGEAQILFQRKDHSYVVYDRLVRSAFGADGRNEPQSTSGLLVQRRGRTLSNRQCIGKGEYSIDRRGAAHVPSGPFTEH